MIPGCRLFPARQKSRNEIKKLSDTARPPGFAGQRSDATARGRWGRERSDRGQSPVSPKGEPLVVEPGRCLRKMLLFYYLFYRFFLNRCYLLRWTAFRGAWLGGKLGHGSTRFPTYGSHDVAGASNQSRIHSYSPQSPKNTPAATHPAPTRRL